MTHRTLPIRPNLDQLKHQAKDLLRALRRGDANALATLQTHHSKSIAPERAKLADAQHALARSYGITSWPRLVLVCRMAEAIWSDDVNAVVELVREHPKLVHEDTLGTRSSWGAPMAYAANLGRDRIIAALRDRGATDLQHAFDRACLQGRLETARQLYAMGARPERDAVMGPAETQSGEGMAFLLELGAEISDAHGSRLAHHRRLAGCGDRDRRRPALVRGR